MQITELKKTLNSAGIRLSKKLDQHFIIDGRILKREVDYAAVTFEETVLEIGPGIGTLTKYLANSAKKVMVFKKDKIFEPFLKEIPNTEVIIGDALKIEFPACDKILSNVPYS
ncbi:TPA: hypothetical protein H1009_00650, partial [archaeon]|nr:hypothetical protein [Candidatus Naiadarchaeales archaeon SRR2090153.bin461]